MVEALEYTIDGMVNFIVPAVIYLGFFGLFWYGLKLLVDTLWHLGE